MQAVNVPGTLCEKRQINPRAKTLWEDLSQPRKASKGMLKGCATRAVTESKLILFVLNRIFANRSSLA